MTFHDTYGYEMWTLVVGLVALSLFFITKYLPMRTRFEKRSGSMLVAFLTALFAEMYGFPLTIYLLSSFLGIDIPLTHEKGHLLGDALTSLGLGNGWHIVMVMSSLLLLVGILYITNGWREVYAAHGKLVTGGIYGKMRHPQYTGISLVIIAFMIQWPTILTLIMFPFLIYMYYDLARREERDILAQFPREYARYRERTPMFVPKPLLSLVSKKYTQDINNQTDKNEER